MEDPNALNIYTDGSGQHNPRVGGIGVRFVFPDNQNLENPIKDFVFCGYKGAVSGEMELQACVSALQEYLKIPNNRNITRIIIHSDSMYLVSGYKNALSTWPRNGWTLLSGGPVLNAELWKKIVSLAKKTKKRVDVQWVKGHAKNLHNKAADKLADESSRKVLNKSSRVVNVRRKSISQKTERGSVEVFGQIISIRIVESEYLKTQKIYRYRYEVISINSKYYKKMDLLTSEFPLKVGHYYKVRLNDESTNPKIIKVFKEFKGEGSTEVTRFLKIKNTRD